MGRDPFSMLEELKESFYAVESSLGDYVNLSIEPLISITEISFKEAGIISKTLKIVDEKPSPLLSVNIALNRLKGYIEKIHQIDPGDSEELYEIVAKDAEKIRLVMEKLQILSDYINLLKRKKQLLQKVGYTSIYDFLGDALEAIRDGRWESFAGLIGGQLDVKVPAISKPRIMVYGKDIGKVIVYMLHRAKERIIIFTQNFHDFKIEGENERIANILKRKASEGVSIGIICRHPENTPPQGRETFIKSLEELQNVNGITIFMCWHMHMKIILVDNIVIVGSANFTHSGMYGAGEVAFVIDDERYVKEILTLYKQILNRDHYICKNFCKVKKCFLLNQNSGSLLSQFE